MDLPPVDKNYLKDSIAKNANNLSALFVDVNENNYKEDFSEIANRSMTFKSLIQDNYKCDTDSEYDDKENNFEELNEIDTRFQQLEYGYNNMMQMESNIDDDQNNYVNHLRKIYEEKLNELAALKIQQEEYRCYARMDINSEMDFLLQNNYGGQQGNLELTDAGILQIQKAYGCNNITKDMPMFNEIYGEHENNDSDSEESSSEEEYEYIDVDVLAIQQQEYEDNAEFSDKETSIDSSNSDKIYICKVCGMEFFQNKSLLKHYQSHIFKKLHECQKCDTICEDIKEYKMHLKTHHLKTHNLTPQNLKRFNLVPMPLDIFWMPPNAQIYACNICPKQFREKRYLSTHLRTHSNIKLLYCKICNGSFSTNYNLKHHMLSIHSDIALCDLLQKRN